MKTADEITPNYGPVYAAAMYPGLCSIFQRHGYALAAHGSLTRDFDLIAVPWTETVSSPEEVLKAVTTEYAVELTDAGEQKNHGRFAYTLRCGFGECRLDLSFMPAAPNSAAEKIIQEKACNDLGDVKSAEMSSDNKR